MKTKTQMQSFNNDPHGIRLAARCACGLEAVIRTSWTNRNSGRRFYGCPTLMQRKAQQANELSNLTRQRQLLVSVNYRRAIIEELERFSGNLVACKMREHLKLIQKAVFIEVIELKKELCLHVLHKIETHVCSDRIWLLIIDTKLTDSRV
ncbi:zinc finger, GRF-type containing protein [Tanacetum coccineum]